jgi:cysteinyl-tRNA synthetase
MSLACLGEAIDVHTGGEDNIFPHHECEIAQSCCALGTTVPGPEGGSPRVSFARFWVHGRHLLVESRKMSKRDGTFFTVRDLLDPVAAGRADLGERLAAAGFEGGRVPATVLRLTLMWSHYRQPMNFSFDLLTQARNAVARLQSLYDRAVELGGTGAVTPAVPETITAGLAAFDEALADDLNMERAMAAVLDLVSRLNQQELAPADGPPVRAALESLDQILEVLARRRMGMVEKERLARWTDPAFVSAAAARLQGWRADAERAPLLAALESGSVPAVAAVMAVSGALDDELIEVAIAARQAAKKARDFASADSLRAHLKNRGIVIEDLPTGIRWKAT